uniref:Uncharacterized protein n=1 Tax=Rhizophora mucronata TaxID=61149 RepID=A0A2P2P416_RHIMU
MSTAFCMTTNCATSLGKEFVLPVAFKIQYLVSVFLNHNTAEAVPYDDTRFLCLFSTEDELHE